MIVLAKVGVMVQIVEEIDLCICHGSNGVDVMEVAMVVLTFL